MSEHSPKFTRLRGLQGEILGKNDELLMITHSIQHPSLYSQQPWLLSSQNRGRNHERLLRGQCNIHPLTATTIPYHLSQNASKDIFVEPVLFFFFLFKKMFWRFLLRWGVWDFGTDAGDVVHPTTQHWWRGRPDTSTMAVEKMHLTQKKKKKKIEVIAYFKFNNLFLKK